MNKRCTIKADHCECCGSTAPEDVQNLRDTDGYTRCCNKLVSYGPTGCRNYHNW